MFRTVCLLGCSALLSASVHAQCNPVRIAHVGGDATSVLVRGTTGYLCFAGSLRIVNVTNPAAPALLGETIVPGRPERMDFLNNHIYLAMGDLGVAVVDVGTPASPTVVATIPGEQTDDVSASGGLAFIARDDDVRIYDVSTPSAPVFRSTYASANERFVAVASSGTTVYALSSFGEVHVVDAANPAAPVLLATYSPASSSIGQDVALRGSTLAVLLWDGVELVDVTNPAAPILRATTPCSTIPDSVTLAQSGATTLMYYEGDSCEVYCYDTTNIAAPIFRSAITGACSGAVAAAGSTLYLAGDTVVAYDMSAPASPIQVYTNDPLPDFPQGVAAIGQHVLVGTRLDALLVYDATNPAAPTLVYTQPLGGLPHEIVRIGRTVYIAEYVTPETSGLIEVFDCTNPAAPVLLGSIATDDYLLEMAVKDGRAYTLSGDETLEIFDVSNPAAMVRLGGIPDAGRERVSVTGSHVLVPDYSGGVRVYDVSDPTVPTLVATHLPRPGENVYDLVIRDTTAFLLQSDSRIDILDVTDPVHPVSQSFITSTNYLWSLGVADSLLVIGVNGEQLRFYDTSNPAAPVQLPIIPTGFVPSRIDIGSNTLWGVNAGYGLHGVSLPQLPRLTEWPEDAHDCPGAGTVQFSVRVANPGAAGGAMYQWLRGAAPVANGVTASGATISGATTRVLSIADPKVAELGNYTCQITNACGTATTAPAGLSLGLPPIVTNPPDDVTACAGASATFEVVGIGTVPFTFQWQYESPFGSGTYLPVVNGSHPGYTISGATARVLALTPTSGQSLPGTVATNYRCVVTNTCSTITSASAALTICRADIDCSGNVSVQDVFDFLTAYFAADPAADVNYSGSVTVQDVFDFLTLYFAGCA